MANLPNFEFYNSCISGSLLHNSISTTVSPLYDVITPSSTSGGGSEPETVSIRANPNPAPPKGKIAKRRSRASKRSPTTFIAADTENFRQMVQQVTGVRFGSGQFPVCSVVKPEPQMLQAGYLLPTLDTSAFLLEHHHQQAEVAPPRVVADGGGGGGFGFGFDLDGFSCFPTLESWKVM